uniref:CPSF_A domain-containing protein n=1 Tax=Syphacia muris TaxID=451379 RepID=A0A0N5ASH4_9BILA
MGTLLNDFFVDVKSAVIGGYLDVGLLVYNSEGLHLLSSFLLNANGHIAFSRKVKFFLQPVLTKDSKVQSIETNEIGSRIALVGLKHVFVIEVPKDLWGRFSTCSSKVGEHVLSDYYCRCLMVGNSISSTSRSFHIIKAQWYVKEFQETGAKVNKLAVLYSNSVIRIFDTETDVDIPIVKVDFGSVIYGQEYDASFQNSFGLRNNIVSFDFGPLIEVELENEPYSTIFAVDTANDVYVVPLRFDNSRILSISGPHKMFPIDSTEADSDIYDFAYIRHRASGTLPVFSIISNKGSLFHFVMIRNNEVFIEGQYNLDFMIYDNIQLTEEDASLFTKYKIVLDSFISGHYFVLGNYNVFSIDVTPWVNSVVRAYNFGVGSAEDVDLKETCVNHVFSVISGKNEGRPQENFFFTSLGALFVKADDFQYPEAVEIIPDFDKRMIVAAATEDGLVFTKIILYQLAPPFRKSSGQPVILDPSSPPLVEKVKKILSKNMTEKELLTAGIKIVDRLIINLVLIKSVYDLIYKSVSNALEEAEDLGRKELNHNQRLLEVVSDFSLLKNRIYSVREAVNKGKCMIDQICGSFSARMFPLTEAEILMQKELEEMQLSIDGILKQIPILSNQLAAERRKRFGVTKSFYSSVNAKKFMLSKSSDEIDGMLTWIKRLQKKLDNLNDCDKSSLDGSKISLREAEISVETPLKASTPLKAEIK